jgi:hypothetical protein
MKKEHGLMIVIGLVGLGAGYLIADYLVYSMYQAQSNTPPTPLAKNATTGNVIKNWGFFKTT